MNSRTREKDSRNRERERRETGERTRETRHGETSQCERSCVRRSPLPLIVFLATSVRRGVAAPTNRGELGLVMMLGKLESIMENKQVTKATSKDEAPTPGYLLNEIARTTQASDEASHKLEEFLLKRLSKETHPQIVLKTLKLAKYCCENGHPSFRRGIQRRVNEIRPFLGEAPTRTAHE